MLESFGREDLLMPRIYPPEFRRQVIELARSGTRVKQLAAMFEMSDATIYELAQAGSDRSWRGRGRDRQPATGARRGQATDPTTRDGACGRAQGQRGVPSGGDRPKRLYPVIESLTGRGISVQHALRTLGVSESGYYDWRGRPDAPRTFRRIWLAGEIADVDKASGGTYGALRVTAELRYGRDIRVGHGAVALIMREIGIRGLPTRRLPRGAMAVEGLLRLTWSAGVLGRDRPNELWLTDITEHPTREGKVYCAVVLDVFSRLVVGWSIDSTQTTTLVLNALGMTTQRRQDRDGLVKETPRTAFRPPVRGVRGQLRGRVVGRSWPMTPTRSPSGSGETL